MTYKALPISNIIGRSRHKDSSMMVELPTTYTNKRRECSSKEVGGQKE
jgi:hypothetical protein